MIYNIEDKDKRKIFLTEINHKDNIDLCAYAIKAIKNGHDAWLISISLEDIIGDLKLNKESLLGYFSIMNQVLHKKIPNTTRYT
ncbi:MAG: hypothetical protein LBH07_06410 [Treponema sp.]|jgi:hypothetical protein|nr:hypothetical protein [Treponema sp.]